MAKRKSGLGNKGVEVLLSSSKASKKVESEGASLNIDISLISVSPYQPRTNFDEDNLKSLIESIREQGIIQPILIRKLTKNKYELIAGERRLRAAKILGHKTIPGIIKTITDEVAAIYALLENVQRENLNPIEIAISFQRLIKECNLTQEECGNKLGKQRSTITNFLRLLKLPLEIQDGLKRNKISVGHARALINLKDTTKQLNIYHDIIENGFSVREVEQLVKDFAERDYNSTETGQIFETSLSQYRIVYDKTFVQNGKYRSFIVIAYSLES